MELDYFLALKLFLVIGPVLGVLALELTLAIRDRRRKARGVPLVPRRVPGPAPVRATGREVRLRRR